MFSPEHFRKLFSRLFHQADNHVSANGNGNVNGNVNVNVNVNVNASLNANLNSNLNANVNGNVAGIVSKTSLKVGVGGGGSKASERNDHPRNDHKSQDGIGTGESNAGCRPRTTKEAAHENVSLDRKLDGADPISGKYFRRYSAFTL